MKSKIIGLIILLAIWVTTFFGIDFLIDYLTNDVSPFYVSVFVRFSAGLIVASIWISVLFRSENTANKMPWLLLLIVAPIFGSMLFLSFARDYKKSKRYKKKKLIHHEKYLLYEARSYLNGISENVNDVFKYTASVTNHSIYANNSSSKILIDGDDFYGSYFEKISKAKEYIFIAFYIIRSDSIGRYLIDLLIKKAEEGVEVKIIYDYLGSQDLKRKDLKKLRSHGIRIYPIDKIIVPIFNTKINYRYHRKITIIDGEYAFTGGFNVGNEYLLGTKKYRWRDTHLLIEGGIVKSLTAVFARDWYYVTDELISDEKYYKKSYVENSGYYQVLQSGPDTVPIIRNTYLKMIYSAKKYIYISTPYLGLDKETETALKVAAKSGVDIRILIPGVPDKKTVYKVTESFIESLLEEGVKIYKFNNTFNHSKFIVVDDYLASCGTYNLDVRSSIINFENTILMSSKSVQELRDCFLTDLENSSVVSYNEWRRRSKFDKLITAVLNLFTPLA
ncbi:cardiolipin synthase [Mycoplasmatota bacterium]|nr:cardiolipin synthase [Mycoplasmatota bacterium]